MHLLAEMCLFYANRRIIIVDARIQTGRRLAAQLRDLRVPVRFSRGGATIRTEESRVWVVTQRGLSAIHVESDKADIVITVDALESLGQQSLERLLFAAGAFSRPTLD